GFAEKTPVDGGDSFEQGSVAGLCLQGAVEYRPLPAREVSAVEDIAHALDGGARQIQRIAPAPSGEIDTTGQRIEHQGGFRLALANLHGARKSILKIIAHDPV